MMTFLRSIRNSVDRLLELAREDINHPDVTLSRLTEFLVLQIRLFYFVFRAFFRDRLLTRASALVYYTLLSIVPLLALSFALLNAFGFTQQMEPALNQLFQPLGEVAVDKIVPTIIQSVNNINFGVIGGIGVLVLLFSVLSIINNIERAFNDIWQIKKSRPLHRKITDYISVVLLVPLLLVVIIGLTASLQSIALVQKINSIPGFSFLFNKTVPLLASWIFFFFILTFIPNTKVKWKSALVATVIGGTIWQISNWFFARFAVTSYQYGPKAAVYAGLATLPMFLLWLYMNWAIILISAEISFINQNLSRLTVDEDKKLYSQSFLENIALKIVLRCSSRFDRGEQPPTTEELGQEFGVPTPYIETVTERLKELAFLHATDESKSRFVPAISLDKLKPIDIILALRRQGIDPECTICQDKPVSEAVARFQQRVDRKLETGFRQTTIQNLVRNRMTPSSQQKLDG
ncbi:MAG TPA: YihY/virulence factor BrkB family protein [bacterium]|nr:YihY/virulence factor BrkB family protein [bacterium]HNT64254.1 YihY/virulence factor BrkB family protein [bacterium]HPG44403.1 YihY/virulence factor BrkB family protein [bacterium]HPM96961.1 YihY/virulence factor BrkB family protein [bacterium]